MNKTGIISAIVCGGRDYQNHNVLNHVMLYLIQEHQMQLIIQGGARGADKMAWEWSLRNDFPCLNVPAKWDQHGRAAGYIRNAAMADYQPSYVVAFPGGRGTAMMIDLAEKREIPRLVLDEQGVGTWTGLP